MTPSTELFKNYYSQDGLQSNEFRFGATFVDKNGDPYKLFQILMSNITYAVIVEILFLISSVMEKYLLTCINSLIIKWICALDAGIFTHIVIVLLTIIKNIYYSFWKPE